MRKSILSFIVVGALIVGFAACNNPGQKFNFKIGNHLHIDGPATVTLLPDTNTVDKTDRIPTPASYSVVYGTVKKTYKWSVSGDATLDSTYWYKDLKAAITFPVTQADSTFYTIKINDGTHNGKLKVKVCHSTELTDAGFCMKQK